MISILETQAGELKAHQGCTCQCWGDSGLQLDTHNIQWHSLRAMRTWQNHPPTVLLGVPTTQTHTPLHISCHAVCWFVRISVAPPAAFYWFCGSKSHQGLAVGSRQGPPWVEVKNSGQGVETCFRWREIKRMILNDSSFRNARHFSEVIRTWHSLRG